MRAFTIAALLATITTGCARNAAAPRADAADPDFPRTEAADDLPRDGAAALPPAAAREPAAAARLSGPAEYVFDIAPGSTVATLAASIADLAPRRMQDVGSDQVLVSFDEDPGISRLATRLGEGVIVGIRPYVRAGAQGR
jgi:hypothetical protein